LPPPLELAFVGDGRYRVAFGLLRLLEHRLIGVEGPQVLVLGVAREGDVRDERAGAR
jgi:hypothetical protein